MSERYVLRSSDMLARCASSVGRSSSVSGCEINRVRGHCKIRVVDVTG